MVIGTLSSASCLRMIIIIINNNKKINYKPNLWYTTFKGIVLHNIFNINTKNYYQIIKCISKTVFKNLLPWAKKKIALHYTKYKFNII